MWLAESRALQILGIELKTVSSASADWRFFVFYGAVQEYAACLSMRRGDRSHPTQCRNRVWEWGQILVREDRNGGAEVNKRMIAWAFPSPEEG